jgi:DNA-binding CsgD family transcriptional regulator
LDKDESNMPETNILSDREKEILKLVATGLTNREIAQALTISPNTVKVHLSNIFEKINVSSRTEATLYGIEHGIVDVPGTEEKTSRGRSENNLQKYQWIFLTLLFLVVIAFVVFGENLNFTQNSSNSPSTINIPDRWQELAPLSEERAGLAVATYNNDIYAIAGETENSISKSVEKYDPQTDTWTRLSDKPTPVVHVSAVVLGEKIYVPGGELAGGVTTDVLEVYDPRKDVWETKAPLPIKISGYALAAFEGQLFLFGGWDAEEVLNIALRYDPDDDKWEELTPMPTARAYAGAVDIGGKILVIGGWDGKQALDVNESFAPAREDEIGSAWEVLPAMPQRGFGMGVLRIADTVYVVGGDFPENDSGSGFLFSIVNDSWENLDIVSESNEPVSDSGYCFLDGLIYFIGGRSDQVVLSNTRSYQAIYTVLLPITTNQ